MRKIFRITYYFGVILLFGIIAIIGYTQTRSFKTYLRDFLLHESATLMNGELRLDAIEGNLISGFRVKNVHVTEGGMELLSAQRLEIKYDPVGFLFKRVSISNVVIEKPRIYISRAIDGQYNIDRLFKPAPADTTSSAWTINIKRLELAEAEIYLVDSLLMHERQMGERAIPPDSMIDYAHLHLRGLSIIASARIQTHEYSASIKKLTGTLYREKLDYSFAATGQTSDSLGTPLLTLNNLSGDFLLTRNEASARHITLVTPSTHIRFDAGIKGIDITRISRMEELKSVPVDFSLTADNLDTRELKILLSPSVNFLDRSLKLQLTAAGTLEALNVEQLSIQMPESHLRLHGQVRNLHQPRELEMSVEANDNFIAPRDLLECMPGLHLPDLAFLGTVKFSLTYEGRPLDFKTRLTGSTSAGDIAIDGKMKIDPANTTYSGTVAVRSLALGTIFNDQSLSSNIHARITVDGAGFNLHTMTGIAKVEIDSSSFSGLPIQHSVLVFDIADGILRSHIGAAVGSGNYELSSLFTLFQNDSLRYSMSGRIRSLDLADILKDPQYGSDLSFDLTAAGAIGASTRSDTTDLHFYKSSFASQGFESAQANAVFQVIDHVHSHLKITSTMGDLNVDGQFTPASFIAAWQNSYQLITEGVAYRFRSLDSIRSFNQPVSKAQFQPSHVSGVNPLDVHYRLQIKDLNPVGAFIHLPLAGQGIVEGRVVGDSLDMQLSGTADLEGFELDAPSDTLSADTAAFKFFFTGIGYENLFDKFHGFIEPDLHNFEFNGFLFNRLSGALHADSDSSNFRFSAYIDSTAQVDAEGKSHMNSNLMEFEFPRLQTGIGQYRAENSDIIRMTLGSDGFRMDSFTMVHDNEQAAIAGHFSPSGISDLNISLRNFLLPHLKQVLYRGSYARTSMKFDGTLNAVTLFRGSFKHPNIVIDLQADNARIIDTLQLKNKILGRVDSHISYFEHMLGLDVKFNSRPNDSQAPPDLLLSGSLPYEFVLARETPHKLEGGMDLKLKSGGMNLEILEPFVPIISNLSGTITCDMSVKGSIDAPRYTGSMSIRDARFVFEPLGGMPFVLNGDLIPAGDRIQLVNFTIQNDPKERFHVGTMKVSGNFTLLGLNFHQFDFLAQGDLKVMSEERRLIGLKLYGNLFAATGPNGLVWQGDLSSSTVSGEMFIKDASLILPPDRDAESARTSVVNIVFTDDTSHFIPKNGEVSGTTRERMKPGQSINQPAKNKASSLAAPAPIYNSFLDGISYDVRIETQGPTSLRFLFSTQTSEELFADLQGRLYFNRTPELSRLTGQVEVSNRSYYNFFKKFEATGKLLFTGDVLNPELDVTATYQGTHDTTSTQMKAPLVLVTLKITGTRNEPKTKILLQTKTYLDKEWTNWNEGDEEANAMTFIISGQFSNELTDQQRRSLVGSNLGLTVASGMVMGPISEVLRQQTLGIISSVDVSYGGGQLDQSDLRVSGQVGKAVYRMGGRVLTDITNANVSVELPISSIVNSDRYRNLILTLERRVEGIQNAGEPQPRASNGVRLFYRFIF